MTLASRLADLELALPPVATPVGAYVPALRAGSQVITSGQLPLVEGRLELTGKVGREVTPEQAQGLARTAVLNALAAAASVAGGLEAITGVVRVCVFVASDPGFTAQAMVANGASDLLGAVFGDAGKHVRSAVGVAVLPLDAPVEVELTVTVA
jgi:enamine deaminase RidA (YjgF/YER057c/UK114 family)